MMKYHIKEWSDHSASLVAEDGYSLDTFESIDDAIDACLSGCMVDPDHIERHDSYLAVNPLDSESSFI